MTDHSRNDTGDSPHSPHRAEPLRRPTDQAGNEPAPEHESAEQRHARTALAIDGIACAAAAIGTVAIGPGSPLHIRCARAPLAAALGGTSALLLRSARRKPVRNADLERAALINLGWVLTCSIALRRPQSRLGTAVILSTAAFDAGAAIAQWRLRS